MTGTLAPFKPREVTAQALDAERLIARWTEGRSPQTVRAYATDLKQFALWAGRPGVGDAVTWLLSASHGEANEVVHQYKSAMVDAGLASSTVNRRLAALRSIVSLGQRFGMISWSLSVEGLKVTPYRDVAGPGTDAVSAMKAKAGTHKHPAKAARDVAIIRLLYDLALRRSEVTNLDLAHLDIRAGKVSVMGKGRRELKTLTLPARTIEALEGWLKFRGKKPGPLFTNFHRAHSTSDGLRANGLYYVVRSIGAAVDVRTRPHGLRHTSITVGQEKVKDPHKVMLHARHSSMDMTMHYVDAAADAGGEVARVISETL